MSLTGLSFNDIIRTYQQPLYWYVRRVVLVHEDAEDILQETFIKAYRRLWQLRNREALKSWLFTIATNEIRRYYKTHREHISTETITHTDIPEQESVSSDQVFKIISRAMLDMTPLQREVFSLKYYDDMDYERISKITGSSKNSLMVSYHEARKKIEKEINK